MPVQIFRQQDSHLFCGHWNGSPLEIGVTGVMRAAPTSEAYRFHDYHEYYVILQGSGTLKLEGVSVPLAAGTVVMVQPGERHRVEAVDLAMGIQWVIIMERSAPNSKYLAAEEP